MVDAILRPRACAAQRFRRGPRRPRERFDQHAPMAEAGVKARDGIALVQAVHEQVLVADEDLADAVGRDAGGAKKQAIGRADFHRRRDGYSGMAGMNGGFDHIDDVGAKRRSVAEADLAVRLDGDGFAREPLQLGLHGGRSDARKDPAVDVRRRGLRQRVRRMTGREQRGHARRAHLPHVGGIARQRGGRLRVAGVLRETQHRGAVRAAYLRADGTEGRRRRVVPHDRKLEAANPLDRVDEIEDRVVGPRHRRVPAGISRRQPEIRVGLLGRLHRIGRRPAVGRERAAAGVGVQRELDVAEPVAMVREQLRRRRARGLLIAREPKDDVARRLKIRGAQMQKRRRDQRDARFVVGRAAAEEEPVVLDQRERIALPLLAPRGHDVHVREQQHGRATRAVAAISHGEPRRAGGRHDEHVVLGESRRSETAGQIARHGRRLSAVDRRVERDDATVDLERRGGLGVSRHLRVRSAGAAHEPERSRADSHVRMIVEFELRRECGYSLADLPQVAFGGLWIDVRRPLKGRRPLFARPRSPRRASGSQSKRSRSRIGRPSGSLSRGVCDTSRPTSRASSRRAT
jgi:hypothetical protein